MTTERILRPGCAAVVLLTCAVGLKPPSALGNADGGDVDSGSFGRRVQQVVADLKHPEFDDELFAHPLMREMFNSPERFLSDGQTFLLGHPGLPELQSRVAVLALQCAGLDQYLSLLERLSNAAAGTISQWVLFYSVSPGLESSTRLPMGFRDKKIRVALRRAARSPNATPNLREAVKEILDGTIARFIAREKWATALKCNGKM